MYFKFIDECKPFQGFENEVNDIKCDSSLRRPDRCRLVSRSKDSFPSGLLYWRGWKPLAGFVLTESGTALESVQGSRPRVMKVDSAACSIPGSSPHLKAA